MADTAKYIDMVAVRDQWAALRKSLKDGLPEKDADGKKVNPDDHEPGDERLTKLIERATNADAAEKLVSEIQVQAFYEIKGGKAPKAPKAE